MRNLIKKWWFWVIVIVLVIILYVIGVLIVQSKVDTELANTIQFNKEIKKNIEKRKEVWDNL